MASERSRPGPNGLRSARSTMASAFTSAARTRPTSITTSTCPAVCSAAGRRRRRRRQPRSGGSGGEGKVPVTSELEVDERGDALGAEDVDGGEGARHRERLGHEPQGGEPLLPPPHRGGRDDLAEQGEPDDEEDAGGDERGRPG